MTEGDGDYCAPEIIEASIFGNIDQIDLRKTDVFSLGITILELVLSNSTHIFHCLFLFREENQER